VRADYGNAYRELYERHWWWRARETLVLEVIRANQPVGGWRRILDVGCGDGLFFDRLLEFGAVEGVEPFEGLVDTFGKHRSQIHIGGFDERLQLDGHFPLILMLDVLEHMPEPVRAIQYALQLLDSGGLLLVTVPAFMLLWTTHDIINQHYTRYTKKSFRNLASRAGLQIESERYFFQWLFPAKIATRIAERIVGSEPAPPMMPGAWINELLYRLSRVEQRTWGRLPIPGSSLMVLGRQFPGHKVPRLTKGKSV
jgi:SAM-dependent methyltransferase